MTSSTEESPAPPPPSPSPSSIMELAASMGYVERRPTASSTLFLQESSPEHSMPPILVNIYHTTRSIMTYMNHPSAGSNELWRSNAYRDLEELRTFLANPRRHSGKGYRKKQNAVRGCAKCGAFKRRTEFSKNQWIKGPDLNKCRQCVEQAGGTHRDRNSDAGDVSVSESKGGGTGDNFEEISDHLGVLSLDDSEATFPSLTPDLLRIHNKELQNDRTKHKNNLKHNHNRPKEQLERRQFNCPECPKQGRGKHVFFKKVPPFKPIVKCPQCKRVTRGRCMRLYPIPKSSEKGYGLYRCHVHGCEGKWGSSRAVKNIGQECHACREAGRGTVFVKPFRLEVVKNQKKTNSNKNGGGGGILGGGPEKKMMRRVLNHAPLGEDEEAKVEYTHDDRRRNEHGGNDALLGAGRRGRATAAGAGRYGAANHGNNTTFRYEERGGLVPESSSGDSEYDGSSITSGSELDGSSSITAGVKAKAPSPLAKIGIPSGYTHKCEGCASGICRSRYLPKSLQHDQSDGNTVSTSASVVTNSSVDKCEYVDRDEDFDGFDLDSEQDADWSLVSSSQSGAA